VEQVLNDIAGMLDVIITWYLPILPAKATKAQQMLDTQEKGILFDKISLS
jgi:hypothetical protein